MTTANIEIELSGGESDGTRQRFEPGGRLEGTVRVTPAEDIHCRRVVLRVGWHTFDRGNPDRGPSPALEQPLAEGPLSANTMISQPFALDLPRQPWSFAGAIVTIIWEACVIIDVPLAPDITLAVPFTLAPHSTGGT